MIVSESVQVATKVSLIIQVLTGIIGAQALTYELSPADQVLKQILGLELLVQVVEFIFYLSFIYVLHMSVLTQRRYADWFLSTPVMLFTISLYFYYVDNIQDKPIDDTKEPFTMQTFTKDFWRPLLLIGILNAAMLFFGYLGEINAIDKWTSFTLGTGALIGAFGTIYLNFGGSSKETKTLFWLMSGIWSLYGVSFLLPSIQKNIGYTVLDVISKNFFGLFLSYIVIRKATV